jgi:hypothetical protein
MTERTQGQFRWRALALASVGALALGALAQGAPAAHAASAGIDAAAKAPAGSSGELSAVTAVPHSSDVWAIGSVGTVDNAHFFIGHRHRSRWQKVKAPNLGGRYGALNTIAAASARTVWLGGGRQLKASSVATVPTIWRWSGKKFVAQKLPTLSNLSNVVSSISASSATNAWAVGGLYPGPTAAQVAFHWNGKKWSAVTVPSGYSQNLYDVSTSGPNNAWALRSDYLASQTAFVHWNGKQWTENSIAPAGVTLSSVATSSAKLTYATGYSTTTSGGYRSVLLKFNGKTWSKVALAKSISHLLLGQISMHGKSAWVIGVSGARPMILHTTGDAWQAERSPGKGYQLTSVSAGSATHAYAVGDYTAPSSGNPPRTFFAALTGHSWKAEPSKL